MNALNFFISQVVWEMHWVLNGMLQSVWVAIAILPLLILFELPLAAIVITGMVGHLKARGLNASGDADVLPCRYPTVSCLVLCYSEGEGVAESAETLLHQDYPGHVEVIMVIDGANANQATLMAARRQAAAFKDVTNRTLRVVPKWQRGGRVSSLNTGLGLAWGELVYALDGDTGFAPDMITRSVVVFEDPDVLAAAGNLRIRNRTKSLMTRLQSLEYLLSIEYGRTGLARWNLINNISGAFGIFRTDILRQIGGWDTHTAEDLDLTLRLKQYQRRHPCMRLAFIPDAIGFTDGPDTVAGLASQRMRWEGDLYFVYLRKHWHGIRPRLMGWPGTLFTLAYGLVQSVALPFLIGGYVMWWYATQPLVHAVAISVLLYLIYLALCSWYALMGLLCVSRVPSLALRDMIWLPVLPIYQLSMRLLALVAILNEMLRRSHEETSMAPWWVLRRGNRF
ncbi:glycosyltransferase family 2 protein [Cobetia marina]|uniref:glycosyltransferase family 2 protein n=1 Tax=Cobetia marina TaxID=28258 RepID=UPI0010AEB004|nr:glycosyltransferase [Cobetia marina]TKD64429.1 glycosyltransferase family 2 protein [Cobetia marina]GED42796.1 N-acetylglucosaminyltransferase [Cobetia marina]